VPGNVMKRASLAPAATEEPAPRATGMIMKGL
jgi:hypothetical protein